MNISKHLVTALAVAALFSCKKEPKTPDTNKEVDVYVAGYQSNIATLWKNGSPQVLGDGKASSSTQSLFVSGGDVFVTGYDQVPGTASYLGRLWKNGTNIIESTTGKNVADVFVIGDDVYYTGSENGVPKYWKNGTAVTLEAGTTGNNLSIVPVSIFVSDGDVHVAGNREGEDGHSEALYWKNGSLSVLSTPVEGNKSVATSIYVSGGHVYIAGYHGNGYIERVPLYWKNGTPNVLPVEAGRDYSVANAVFVSGGNVYIAGKEYQFDNEFPDQLALYWKNGVRHPVESNSDATSIFVFGNDVYTAGYGKYWKNTTPVALGGGGMTDIFVVERPK